MKMKHGLGSLFLTLAVCPVGPFAASPARGAELHPVKVTNLFVPVGFDDNDEIVVAVDGYLPDPCHKLRRPDVTVDKDKKIVTVAPMAERVTGMCPDVIVPYQTTIAVGGLAPGGYTVVTFDGEKREALTVKRASGPGPDEYLYAPVDSAHVSRYVGGGTKATLRGRLTDSCLELTEARVIDSGKTFEVLPILRMNAHDKHGRPCRAIEIPFEKTVDLPALKPGRYLLHVRSMNGQSLNEIFSTYW